MNFRDFMTNPRSAFGKFFRRKPVKVETPPDPSREDVEQFVQMLVDDVKAKAAEKVLRRLGKTHSELVADALIKAAPDPRYHEPHFERRDFGSPIQQILSLLERLDRNLFIRTAVKLSKAPSDHVRKCVADFLGGVGSVKLVPVLARLLNDDDGYVRSYVWYGVRDAIEKRPEYAAAMYPLYLEQCDQDYNGTLNDSPEHLFALDRKRAAVDLSTPRFLSLKNPIVHEVLKTLEHFGVTLPEATIRPLLAHGLHEMKQERTYPNEYLVAAALKALARSIGKSAAPDLRAAMDLPDDRVQEAAAEGLARLAGVEDAVGFALKRCEKVGVDGLTEPQRTIYLCWLFEAEVCNGGLAQLFGNSSGDYAVETMAALKAVEHPEATAALATAMKLLGPAARERDRDRRVKPFETKYDALVEAFDPLESAFYKTKGRFRQAMLRYAVDHAEHFHR